MAELPTSITPTRMAKPNAQVVESDSSNAWPLSEAETNIDQSGSKDSMAQNGNLPRSNSAGYNIFPPPTFRCSISSGSQLTTAPEEDLPPLPMIQRLDPIDLSRKNSKLSRRFSILSMDSITDEALANNSSTSRSRSMVHRPRRPSSAGVNFTATGAHGSERPRRPDPTPLPLGSPVGRQASKVSDRNLHKAKSYQGSIRSPTTPNSSDLLPGPLQPVHDRKLNIQRMTESPDLRSSLSNQSSRYSQDSLDLQRRHSVFELDEGSIKHVFPISHSDYPTNDRGSPVRRSTRRTSSTRRNSPQYDQRRVSIGFPDTTDELDTGSRRSHKSHHYSQTPSLPWPERSLSAQLTEGVLQEMPTYGGESSSYARDSIVESSDLSSRNEYTSTRAYSPEFSGAKEKSESFQSRLSESIIQIPGLGLLDEDYERYASAAPLRPPTNSIFENRPTFDQPTNASIQTKSATITSRASTLESSVFDSPSPFNPTPPRNSARSQTHLHQPVPKSPTPTALTLLTTESPILEACASPPLPSPTPSTQAFPTTAPPSFRPQAKPRGPRPGPPSQSRSPSTQKPQNPNRGSVVVMAQMLRRMDSVATASDDNYLNFFESRRRSSSAPPPPLPDKPTSMTMRPHPLASLSPSTENIPRAATAHHQNRSPQRTKRDAPPPAASASGSAPFPQTGALNIPPSSSRTPSSALSIWDDTSIKADSQPPLPAQSAIGGRIYRAYHPKLAEKNMNAAAASASGGRQGSGSGVASGGMDPSTENKENWTWSDEVKRRRSKRREGMVDGPRVSVQTPTPEEGDGSEEGQHRGEGKNGDSKAAAAAAGLGLGHGLELGLELPPRGLGGGEGWGGLMGE
ncbi:MAG: hypothetical protein Q9160_007136 [Pyrenula sp. 1 TL-2023]